MISTTQRARRGVIALVLLNWMSLAHPLAAVEAQPDPPLAMAFGPEVLLTLPEVGRRVDGVLVADERHSRAGFLAYGPYVQLPAGRYAFSIEIEALDGAEHDDGTYWDVAGELGLRQFVRLRVAAGRAVLSHELDVGPEESQTRFETRVHFGGRGTLRVFGARIARVGAAAAPPFSATTLHLATIGILSVSVGLFWIAGVGPRRVSTYVARHARRIGLHVVLVAVAAYAVLLAPAPPPGLDCVETRPIAASLRMTVSCDSHEFVRVARKPEELPTSYFQSRPLQVMVASLLAGLAVPRGFGLPPEWMSYVLLNFALVVVAITLFHRLVAPRSRLASAAVVALCAFMLFNDVVKGFFWSAHTQMWNLLVPLIAIGLAAAVLRHPPQPWHVVTAIGALLGIGWLAYGSLVVCVASVLAAGAIDARAHHPGRRLALVGQSSVFLAAFAAPMAVWAGLVRARTGAFVPSEVRVFREFVWIADSWNAGGPDALLRQGWVFAGEFAGVLWDVSWPILLLLSAAAIVGITAPRQLRSAVTARGAALAAAGITLVTSLGFFFLLGFYRHRLEFNVAVPLLFAATLVFAELLERLSGRRRYATLLVIALAVGGYIFNALTTIGHYV